jgi:hypothetical protein
MRELVLVLGRRARDVESLQQHAAVQSHRLLGITLIQGPLQGCSVTPEDILGHPHLFIAAPDYHLGPQFGSQEVEGPPECGSRMLLVQIGPEESKQRVTPVKAAGRGDREISQKAETLGLLEH